MMVRLSRHWVWTLPWVCSDGFLAWFWSDVGCGILNFLGFQYDRWAE